MPNKVPVAFHNGLNYDYHFLIKKLPSNFKGQFKFLGGNSEKYKTFSIPIKKQVTKIDKEGKKGIVTRSYKIKFIDSARFMASLLSNLVDNLANTFCKIKCYDCDCFLKDESIKDNLLKYKCLSWNKGYSNKFDE